jgi:hypothetical protein
MLWNRWPNVSNGILRMMSRQIYKENARVLLGSGL